MDHTRLFFLLTTLSLVFTSCSEAATKPEWALASSNAPTPAERTLKQKWSKTIRGIITDLNVTTSGRWVVFSTVPDPDGSSERDPFLRIYSHKGDVHASKKLPARVRTQAISESLDLILLSTYDEKLLAFDFQGKLKWEKTIHCKPTILETLSKVVCFHDDESKEKLAYEVFSASGVFESKFKVATDPLILKVSGDDFNVVTGLASGKVVMSTPQSVQIWEKLLQGNVVDLAVIPHLQPQVLVVHHSMKKGKRDGQKLSLLKDGNILKEWDLPFHAEQIHVEPKSKRFVLYANNPYGQRLVQFTIEEEKLIEKWKFEERHFADFSSTPVFAGGEVWSGFEDVPQAIGLERVNHLFGFSPEGKLLYDLPLRPEDGAFLFGVSSKGPERFLYVATDQNRLEAYELK